MIKYGAESRCTFSKLFTEDDTSEAGATCACLYKIIEREVTRSYGGL